MKLANTIILNESPDVDKKKEYDEYLKNHISGVQQAWRDCFYDKLSDILDGVTLKEISDQIANHDDSKYGSEEYTPYLNHFYPPEGKTGEDFRKEFDVACLHHYHNNPHHWNYWVLNDDEDKDKGRVLDMPEKYVIEMLCDWHSFSLKDSNSTAYNWWNKNKEKMNMTDNTIKLVEKYIDYVKEPLEKPLDESIEILQESITEFCKKTWNN